MPNSSYTSSPWKTTINKAPEKKIDIYPEKKKINTETIRLTVNEYLPQFSGIVNRGADYIKWINTLDDPYLNRYKFDMEVDPMDEHLKLIWKDKF